MLYGFSYIYLSIDEEVSRFFVIITNKNMFALTITLFITLFLIYFLVGLKLFIRDFSLSSFSREESRSYECGFEQFSLSRIPISIRYFTLTLVFLIFDLEIILLMFVPNDFLYFADKFYATSISLFFILILFLSLFYE